MSYWKMMENAFFSLFTTTNPQQSPPIEGTFTTNPWDIMGPIVTSRQSSRPARTMAVVK